MIGSGWWFPAIPWLLPLLGLAASGPARRRHRLADASPRAGRQVSIIVPARNERDTIDTLLGSLTATTYSPVEILVVDDRSDDDTAARVAAWAARDARVRLLSGAPLPEGWFGKPWACTQGAAAATGELLLFTDADTTHAPTLLTHAVGALEETGADLLTVVGHLECGSFWERIVMPQVASLLAVRYPPALVNRARQPWLVVANGQLILSARASYDALGGHEAVRDQVVEDQAMAQRCVQLGKCLRLLHADELFSTRMYRSLDGMIEGWSKNLHLGTRQSLPPGLLRTLAPVLLIGSFLFWLIPFALLPMPGLRSAALLAIAGSAVYWAGLMRLMRIPVPYLLGYPLGALVALGIVLRSIRRGGRQIVWRGRTYRVGE